MAGLVWRLTFGWLVAGALRLAWRYGPRLVVGAAALALWPSVAVAWGLRCGGLPAATARWPRRAPWYATTGSGACADPFGDIGCNRAATGGNFIVAVAPKWESTPGTFHAPRIAISLHMVPEGRKTAAAFPRSSATISCRWVTVGSSPFCSSPTSASHMNRRMAGVGRVTVSLKRSTSIGKVALMD